jgi:site-specific DNA-methyltransferase (adenine-specific)
MLKWNRRDLTLYNSDFLQSNLTTDSVDLVVTSPPYNVGIGYSQYEDSNSYADYLTFSQRWLAEAFRVLKADGRLCLNIPLDKNKGGAHSVVADLTTVAKQVGFNYHSTIIWNEGNISRRTAWGSWLSASAPYVIAPVEVIVILYKTHWKKQAKGISDTTKEEFISWTNGLWTFNGESKKRVGHPAPFPLELPKRCIKLFSYVGDTVLDPFVGSGTTLIACHQHGRKGIGIELDEEYYRLAIQRVQTQCQLDQLRLEDVFDETKPDSPEPKEPTPIVPIP